MADLYQTSRTNVVEHIKHIYEEMELDEQSTCRNFRRVRQEGNREAARNIPFYNLGMIISLGYRVKSSIATKFRRWATERLKEYMIKGFIMDDERLKIRDLPDKTYNLAKLLLYGEKQMIWKNLYTAINQLF